MTKKQSLEELVQNVQGETENWCPNEYHFISEELFNNLMNLFSETKKQRH